MTLTESLKKRDQFSYVYQNGKSYANKQLVMYIVLNGLSKNRIGISVSKKVGNSVIRHRITRLIRESCRLKESMLKTGFDIVVVARAGAKGKSYSEMEHSFLHLMGLHQLLIEDENSRV